MRCVHLFASVDYNISNESFKKNSIAFRQARQIWNRSKLGHKSFYFPFYACCLFIFKKQSYTFLWEGTAEQASDFMMDLHPPHESGYSGTRHITEEIGDDWSWVLVDLVSWDHLHACGWRAHGSWSSDLPTSRWENTSFVDTGEVTITLLSRKREPASAWAMMLETIAIWWGETGLVTMQEAGSGVELGEPIPYGHTHICCHHHYSSP